MTIDINPKHELVEQGTPNSLLPRCGVCGNKVYNEDRDLNFNNEPICFECFKGLRPAPPKTRCEICGRDGTERYLVRFSHAYKKEGGWNDWVVMEKEVCANCNNDFVVFTLQNWTKEARKRREMGDLKKPE